MDMHKALSHPHEKTTRVTAKVVGIELPGRWELFHSPSASSCSAEKYGKQSSGDAGICSCGSNGADKGGEMWKQVVDNNLRERLYPDEVGLLPNKEN